MRYKNQKVTLIIWARGSHARICASVCGVKQGLWEGGIYTNVICKMFTTVRPMKIQFVAVYQNGKNSMFASVDNVHLDIQCTSFMLG